VRRAKRNDLYLVALTKVTATDVNLKGYEWLVASVNRASNFIAHTYTDPNILAVALLSPS